MTRKDWSHAIVYGVIVAMSGVFSVTPAILSPALAQPSATMGEPDTAWPARIEVRRARSDAPYFRQRACAVPAT